MLQFFHQMILMHILLVFKKKSISKFSVVVLFGGVVDEGSTA
jgi:preprotein translocase subunit SecF